MQNENKPLSKNLFQRFANKYTFVGLLFVIWIALFDKYSFIDRLQLRSKINQLENEQKYYREKIEEDKRKKLQEEANEKTAQMLREAAADTLDKVLYELSGQMKNAYARSDA